MEIINRRQRMASIARKLRRDNRSIALVPTMGALHEGHIALVKEARQMADAVVVSIYVNPAQFGAGEDFEKYPRDLTADAAFLSEFEVDYIFAPETAEIYPPDFSTYVNVEGLSDQLEGASRPGHFRGVATIVAILLNTVRPDLAVFGQKDAQQVAVVKRLVRDLGYETEIIVVPTVRDESGLALSSRNAYLSEAERARAAVISRALRDAKAAFRDGERNAAKLTETVEKTIAGEEMATLDYVAVVDAETLEPIEKIGENEALVVVAARFGPVRLIDNVILNRKQ
jgi:pantoate--beta-alanine ligase